MSRRYVVFGYRDNQQPIWLTESLNLAIAESKALEMFETGGYETVQIYRSRGESDIRAVRTYGRKLKREPTCRGCKFYLPRPDGVPQGFCRRNPPSTIIVPGMSPITMWPTVDHYNWCGEHQPRKPTDA